MPWCWDLYRHRNSAREVNAQEYIDTVSPDFVISSVGALAKIGNAVVYEAMIDAPMATVLLDAILQAPGLDNYCAVTPHGFFAKSPLSPPFASVSDDVRGALKDGTYKIVAQISAGHAKAITEHFPGVVHTIYSGESWISFENIGATKWQAVSAVAAHLGINPAQIAAFGDDNSDVEMLANCGFGVAMGNAISKAKSAAKYVCDDNEQDGVARWLEANLWT